MLTVASGGFSAVISVSSSYFPGRQGFILHTVTRLHRPWVLSPMRESATLCPSPLRGLLIGEVL